MSKNNNDAQAAQPDPETIAAWLAENPGFFVGRDELLEQITLPHESGKAISLVERQVTLLRNRNEQQQKQIHQLMVTAGANDVLFEKTRSLILSLLKCRDADSLGQTLNTELGKLFDSVESHLFFITDSSRFGAGSESGSGVQTKSWTEAQAILGEFFEKKRTTCGALSEDQARFFFPEAPEKVASAAIVPVHVHLEGSSEHLMPVLVTGSTNPEYFHSNQDTLFLDFIGEVLAGLLTDMLKNL